MKKQMTQKDLLIQVASEQKALKEALCGSELHPNGLIQEVKGLYKKLDDMDKEHHLCLENLAKVVSFETEQRVAGDAHVEKEMIKRTSVVGGVVGVFTMSFGALVAWLLRKIT